MLLDRFLYYLSHSHYTLKLRSTTFSLMFEFLTIFGDLQLSRFLEPQIAPNSKRYQFLFDTITFIILYKILPTDT